MSDVGHTLIFGPTGAGKSTFLALLAAQFRRYKNARITVFDKGRSLFALSHAAGGRHYDLAGDTASPSLCPLAKLDTLGDIAFAGEWIETCYQLQHGSAASPQQKEEIHRAIKLMREGLAGQGRSLTDFVATVQDRDIRAALTNYTIEGPLGHLLDARADSIETASFVVYEIEELMGLGEKNLIPVLLYLFRHFERSLTGAPAVLLLDEAWAMLGHPVFRRKSANGSRCCARPTALWCWQRKVFRMRFVRVFLTCCSNSVRRKSCCQTRRPIKAARAAFLAPAISMSSSGSIQLRLGFSRAQPRSGTITTRPQKAAAFSN